MILPQQGRGARFFFGFLSIYWLLLVCALTQVVRVSFLGVLGRHSNHLSYPGRARGTLLEDALSEGFPHNQGSMNCPYQRRGMEEVAEHVGEA